MGHSGGQSKGRKLFATGRALSSPGVSVHNADAPMIGPRLSRSALLLLGLLAAAGCRHDRLTVTFKTNGPDGQDFQRLLSLTEAPENTVASGAEKAVIDFKKDLEMPTREGLMKALDTIKRVDHRPTGPLLAWR